jgi:SNF2 family DNA or RNA helicase
VKSSLSVSVDQNSLSTSLEFKGDDPNALNEMRLLFAGESGVAFSENRIVLTWHTFKIYLEHVAQILKRNRIDLDFDDLGLKLVNEYLDDRENVRQTKIETVSKSDIQTVLDKIGFKRDLKREQFRDAGTLLGLKHGANFSVPGAGKTTTILAVHSCLKDRGSVSKLFVVCPINAFISWEDELTSVYSTPSKIVRLTTSLIDNFVEIINQNPDVILVNYEKLRRESSALVSYFSEHNVHLILDESHRIKGGVNNLSYSFIETLSDLAKRRDVMSGTPMPQSYRDLKPQFDLLWPSEDIIPDLMADSDLKVSTINSAIKGKYVRTTKKELGLKDPQIRYTKVKLGPIQTELYRLFKSETARLISGMDKANVRQFRQIGRSVIRLLQASTNPMLLGAGNDLSDEVSPMPEGTHVWQLLEEFVKYETPKKIEYLKGRVREILKENPHNKIVVWSCFVRNIQLLEGVFKEYNPVSIYGDVPTSTDESEQTREGRIKKFHTDDSCRLMIANPQACGEGISLHKVCHYAIYLDRNFNAAHFLQSIDRIHRLGLLPNQETYVEILIADETIDDVLVKRLSEKIARMGEILNDRYLQTLAYDPADISSDEDELDSKDVLELKKHVTS